MKNIPNFLTVLRLLLVPLFVCVFFLVSPVAALPLFLMAGATDVLDGYLARRNGWISAFGKALDPVADKTMQCAVLIALAAANYLSWVLALLFLAKELAQGICSLIVFRYRHILGVSRWYGKTAISAFYLAVSLTILFHVKEPLVPQMTWMLTLLWSVTLILMLSALTCYIVSYAKLAALVKREGESAELRGAQ